MEYYRGILILTTKRMGQFDDAIIARINVAIRYEITDQDRLELWDKFFTKLKTERRDITVDKKALPWVTTDPRMRKIHWNGREIRNGITTVHASFFISEISF